MTDPFPIRSTRYARTERRVRQNDSLRLRDWLRREINERGRTLAQAAGTLRLAKARIYDYCRANQLRPVTVTVLLDLRTEGGAARRQLAAALRERAAAEETMAEAEAEPVDPAA